MIYSNLKNTHRQKSLKTLKSHVHLDSMVKLRRKKLIQSLLLISTIFLIHIELLNLQATKNLQLLTLTLKQISLPISNWCGLLNTGKSHDPFDIAAEHLIYIDSPHFVRYLSQFYNHVPKTGILLRQHSTSVQIQLINFVSCPHLVTHTSDYNIGFFIFEQNFCNTENMVQMEKVSPITKFHAKFIYSYLPNYFS